MSHVLSSGPRRVAIAAVIAAAAVTAMAAPAAAASPPLSDPRILVHFDLASGQQPENIALEPDGTADLTFATAHQVARVGRDGRIRLLAQLPAAAPPVGSVLGAAFVTGIVRAADGTLYVGYSTGDPQFTGVWRVGRDGRVARIAALPTDGIPNGMALDERSGLLYVADSALGTVWRVCVGGGAPVAWATGAALRPAGFLGANGIKVRGDAVWVTNTDQGTVLRIPIRRDGSAGPIATAVTGLTGPDDFAFAGRGDDMLVALDAASEVALVAPGGAPSIVLTAQDGLSNPTSVAVRGGTVYVPSAAYLTMRDPNLLLARIAR